MLFCLLCDENCAKVFAILKITPIPVNQEAEKKLQCSSVQYARVRASAVGDCWQSTAWPGLNCQSGPRSLVHTYLETPRPAFPLPLFGHFLSGQIHFVNLWKTQFIIFCRNTFFHFVTNTFCDFVTNIFCDWNFVIWTNIYQFEQIVLVICLGGTQSTVWASCASNPSGIFSPTFWDSPAPPPPHVILSFLD